MPRIIASEKTKLVTRIEVSWESNAFDPLRVMNIKADSIVPVRTEITMMRTLLRSDKVSTNYELVRIYELKKELLNYNLVRIYSYMNNFNWLIG